MKFGVPAETLAGETRVAATPETVRKLVAAGHHAVVIQAGAGRGANFPDEEYAAAGATLAQTAQDVYTAADCVLKVRAPAPEELGWLRSGQLLIGLLNPHQNEAAQALAATRVTAFAMERLPRISRAQSMDVLSSQANVGGYKAVLLAANEFQRLMPMLMTAAGTVKAAQSAGSS